MIKKILTIMTGVVHNSSKLQIIRYVSVHNLVIIFFISYFDKYYFYTASFCSFLKGLPVYVYRGLFLTKPNFLHASLQ